MIFLKTIGEHIPKLLELELFRLGFLLLTDETNGVLVLEALNWFNSLIMEVSDQAFLAAILNIYIIFFFSENFWKNMTQKLNFSDLRCAWAVLEFNSISNTCICFLFVLLWATVTLISGHIFMMTSLDYELLGISISRIRYIIFRILLDYYVYIDLF